MNAPAEKAPAATFDAPATARHVVRSVATASLATLDPDGTPFASLVTVATTLAGQPLLLLSSLARHTANLARDSRASLLAVAPGGEQGDPLAGARVSLTGHVARDDDPDTRRRFLARHAEAGAYADFKDFAFYRLAPSGGHLIAGFGRIVDVAAVELVVDVGEFGRSEAGAVAHMNADHAEALALYATRLLGQPDGDWQATGADPEGLDLRFGALRARLPFPRRVQSGGELRAALVELAQEARKIAGTG